jgi:hypothetical protein
MVLALVGMVACAKKQRTNPGAQPVAIGLLVVVVICGITILFKTGTLGQGETQRLIENELKYAQSQAYVLGKYLKETYPEATVLIVADRNYEKSNRQQKLIDGLQEGLGGASTPVTIDTLEIPKDKKGMAPEEMDMMPLEEIMTAKEFDALVKKHPHSNLIISMIGLPRDADKMKLWKKEESKRPKIALLNGDIHNLGRAIKAGFIVAAVSYKPGVKFTEDPCPEDPEKAFEERYIIITPKNIEAIAKKYPRLFQN